MSDEKKCSICRKVLAANEIHFCGGASSPSNLPAPSDGADAMFFTHIREAWRILRGKP